jgi:hypothetical protein
VGKQYNGILMGIRTWLVCLALLSFGGGDRGRISGTTFLDHTRLDPFKDRHIHR